MHVNSGRLYASVCLMIAVACWPTRQVAAETIVPADYDRSVTIRFDGYSGTTALTNFPALIQFGEGVDGDDSQVVSRDRSVTVKLPRLADDKFFH